MYGENEAIGSAQTSWMFIHTMLQRAMFIEGATYSKVIELNHPESEVTSKTLMLKIMHNAF